MNLKIRDIVDAGVKDQERLVIDVLMDDDLGYYLIFDTISISDGTVSSVPRHVYWFPDRKLKKGDLVILYTKKGSSNEKQNKDGSTSYFFYWNSDSVFWTQPNDAVILLESRSWAVKKSPQYSEAK